MTQSHYEINVSWNGRHFFATASRSAQTEQTAWAILSELRDRFPESQGFKVSCTHWEGSGSFVDAEELAARVRGRG